MYLDVFEGFLSFPLIFFDFYLFDYLICVLVDFVFFLTSQDVLGVLEGPWRALKVLGSSPGRFWNGLGRHGNVPGRRPIITFRK